VILTERTEKQKQKKAAWDDDEDFPITWSRISPTFLHSILLNRDSLDFALKRFSVAQQFNDA
jgi:hypothetical protein